MHHGIGSRPLPLETAVPDWYLQELIIQVINYGIYRNVNIVNTVQPTYTNLCYIDIPLKPTEKLSPNYFNAKILRNLGIYRLYKVSPSAISTDFEAKVTGN